MIKLTRALGVACCVVVLAQVATAAPLTLDDVVVGIRQRQVARGGTRYAFGIEQWGTASTGETFDSKEDIRSEAALPPLRRYYHVAYQSGLFHAKRTTFSRKAGRVGEKHYFDEFAWDGRRNASYQRTAQGRPTGLFTSQKLTAYKADYAGVILECSVFDNDKPLAELVDTLHWKYVGEAQIGTLRAVQIEGNPDEDGPTISAWVVPDRDFVPIRIQVVYPASDGSADIIESMDEVILGQTDGIWYVRRAALRVWNKGVGQGLTLVDVIDAHVGVRLPPEEFNVSFPAEALIWDDVSQLSYKIDAGGRIEKVIVPTDKVASVGDVAPLPDTATPPVTPARTPILSPASAEQLRSGRWYLLSSAVAAVLLISLVVVILRRKNDGRI